MFQFSVFGSKFKKKVSTRTQHVFKYNTIFVITSADKGYTRGLLVQTDIYFLRNAFRKGLRLGGSLEKLVAATIIISDRVIRAAVKTMECRPCGLSIKYILFKIITCRVQLTGFRFFFFFFLISVSFRKCKTSRNSDMA